MRFFQKFDISNPLWTGAGWKIPFEDFGSGNGGIATADSYIVGEIQKCIAEQRGGVQEITEVEFQALKKKENQTPFRRWREVLDVRKVGLKLARFHDAAVAAGRRLPEAVRNFTPHEQMTKPNGTSTFRPKAVAR